MKHVLLVGLSGSGKTKIASELSKRLELDHIDTDQKVSESLEKSLGEPLLVSNIFEKLGEEEFRKLEGSILDQCKEKKASVLSLGGGTITLKENFEKATLLGTVIFLDLALDDLEKRGKKLPVFLDNANRSNEIKKLSQLRRAAYLEIADIVLKIRNESVEEIVEKIEKELIKHGK